MLPIIIRLAPQLVKMTFYRGSAIIANKVEPSNEEELAQELNRKIKRDQKEDSRDNQHVIKVADAIECIENGFNSTTLIYEFAKTALRSLLEGRQSEAAGQNLFDQMAKCIRENALRSDTLRRKHKPATKYGRPAKGHGHGRRSF